MDFIWKIISKILSVLGVLSIPILIWNIFLHKDNKKYKKWNAERNSKKLWIERERIESWFQGENEKLGREYKDRRYEDFSTDSEQFNSWEKKQRLLQERKNNKLSEIDADIEYFEKLSGCETSSVLLARKTIEDEIKAKIKRLWQNLTRKLGELIER